MTMYIIIPLMSPSGNDDRAISFHCSIFLIVLHGTLQQIFISWPIIPVYITNSISLSFLAKPESSED